MSKIVQFGLTASNEEQLEEFADRVSNFNKSKGFIVVEMEGKPSDGDEIQKEPHWKVRLEFASKAYFKEFWLDPEYATIGEPNAL